MESVSLTTIEGAARAALTSPRERAKVQDALGWDDSQVSRFLSGQMGLTIDKLDLLMKTLGFVPITPRYLDCLAYMGQIGASCACARKGLGECGR